MTNMSQKRLFNSLGQAHEFELALIKLGVKQSQIQDVITGKLKIVLSSVGLSSASNTEYLKLISDEPLTIDSCNGSRIIANAGDVFSWIDSDFRNWKADEIGQATTDTVVNVYELFKNGMFSEFFSSYTSNVDKLCFSQDQIIGFVKKHRRWLRTDGYATFFLFKSYGNYFVASVLFNSDGTLGVYVRRFEFDDRWDAEDRRRVVVPQLVS